MFVKVMKIRGIYIRDYYSHDKPGSVIRALEDCEWDEFYEILETVASLIGSYGDVRDWYHNQVNEVLRRHYVAYELRDGRVERVGTKLEDEVIAEARAILRDDDLAGPNEQFLKAVGFFSQRPLPDVENCVKEAVGAVEGLAGVLLSDSSILLSDAIKVIGAQKDIHKTLQKLFQNLYAFRGDAQGAAHGSTGAKPKITLADAELTLNASAALIVYLARLYGRSVT
jgi:hypothetical protein